MRLLLLRSRMASVRILLLLFSAGCTCAMKPTRCSVAQIDDFMQGSSDEVALMQLNYFPKFPTALLRRRNENETVGRDDLGPIRHLWRRFWEDDLYIGHEVRRVKARAHDHVEALAKGIDRAIYGENDENVKTFNYYLNKAPQSVQDVDKALTIAYKHGPGHGMEYFWGRIHDELMEEANKKASLKAVAEERAEQKREASAQAKDDLPMLPGKPDEIKATIISPDGVHQDVVLKWTTGNFIAGEEEKHYLWKANENSEVGDGEQLSLDYFNEVWDVYHQIDNDHVDEGNAPSLDSGDTVTLKGEDGKPAGKVMFKWKESEEEEPADVNIPPPPPENDKDDLPPHDYTSHGEFERHLWESLGPDSPDSSANGRSVEIPRPPPPPPEDPPGPREDMEVLAGFAGPDQTLIPQANSLRHWFGVEGSHSPPKIATRWPLRNAEDEKEYVLTGEFHEIPKEEKAHVVEDESLSIAQPISNQGDTGYFPEDDGSQRVKVNEKGVYETKPAHPKEGPPYRLTHIEKEDRDEEKMAEAEQRWAQKDMMSGGAESELSKGATPKMEDLNG
eukprot:gnl/TRDRNA2_/TRDRNA2_37550_c0_seq1.p1 gnl/TRDRNA2_/TRDRNA2_37550_c0~~gnl/TRDRNA2_/TRDRNA2_37550_c0_seq1.p1  ORF type:complete len:561 (+),score=107.85 gnl/TRDRNA2_/TRDRNA2_37550_c0_seq1:134-1816(+)